MALTLVVGSCRGPRFNNYSRFICIEQHFDVLLMALKIYTVSAHVFNSLNYTARF